MLILPSLSREQVQSLIDRSEDGRNEAVIALFAESGLKLRELTDIKLQDTDWDNRTIRVSGKGNKEGYAPPGPLSEQCLRDWLAEPQRNGNIRGMDRWGIVSMLRRLEADTGLP
ncbi:MAG: tyrosine-type recombinase/integrase [Chloroflexi bacterium]|nr:tyrosine-type recombinase/integrase [Chloroflexota bacterium]